MRPFVSVAVRRRLGQIAKRVGRLKRQLVSHGITDLADATETVRQEKPHGIGIPELGPAVLPVEVEAIGVERAGRSEHRHQQPR